MKIVGAYLAKTNLSKLLDEVSQGRTILISRRGKAVAELRPVLSAGALDAEAAMADLLSGGGLDLNGTSIRELIDEGRGH